MVEQWSPKPLTGVRFPSPLLIRGKTMAKSEERKRECLNCDQKFKSKWAGNRICSKCKNSRIYKQKINTPIIKISGGTMEVTG